MNRQHSWIIAAILTCSLVYWRAHPFDWRPVKSWYGCVVEGDCPSVRADREAELRRAERLEREHAERLKAFHEQFSRRLPAALPDR